MPNWFHELFINDVKRILPKIDVDAAEIIDELETANKALETANKELESEVVFLENELGNKDAVINHLYSTKAGLEATVSAKDASIAELETWKADNEFGASVFEGRKSGTDWSYMFKGCSNLTTVPLFDTSKVQNASYMFSNCSSLTTIPLLDTSKVTNMSGMFIGCNSLTTIPPMDTGEVTNTYTMFSGCNSLTTVPQFDISKVTNTAYMFNGCHSLTTVPQLDARNVTSISGMLANCVSLTECWLRNIKVNLQVGSSTWGHLLTVESLIHLIKECRDTGSMKTLTIGSVNMEKMANVYVKLIPITDEMRVEDDLIDEKLPFEVCESTDEGAILITDYVGQKNWKLG